MSNNGDKSWILRLARFITGNEEQSSSSDNEPTEAGPQESYQASSDTKSLPSMDQPSSEPIKPTKSSKKRPPKLSEENSMMAQLARKLVKEKLLLSPTATQPTDKIDDLMKGRMKADLDATREKFRRQRDAVDEQRRRDEDAARRAFLGEKSEPRALQGIASINVRQDYEEVETVIDMILGSQVNVVIRMNGHIEVDYKIQNIVVFRAFMRVTSLNPFGTVVPVGEFHFEGKESNNVPFENAKSTAINEILKLIDSA